MNSYFDLHVIYTEKIEEVLSRLLELGFKYVCIEFSFDQRKKIEDIKKKAKEIGIEAFSRIDLDVRNAVEYHRNITKSKAFFDIISIRKAPEELLKNVNLRRTHLINLSTVTTRLLWKIKASETFLEFNFSEFFSLLRKRDRSYERLLTNALIYDFYKLPIILCSGASEPRNLLTPLQMIYSFPAIIGKKEINKKYILTLPQLLIRKAKLGVWKFEGI